MSYTPLANLLRLESPDTITYPESNNPRRVSMSPNSGDVAQTPESKSSSSSGLASSLFKSLTGGGKGKAVQSPSPTGPRPNGTSSEQVAEEYSGPPNLEKYYCQLKPGNPLPDRVSAAEALKYSVQDYPLEGVGTLAGGSNTTG